MLTRVRFIGDPFVDAGVAVLEWRLNKPSSQFNSEDLAAQARELEDIYSKAAWASYLTVHFPNSCWCNFTMGKEKKRAQRDLLLRSFDAPALPGRFCSYCRNKAQQMADRSVIPLITGAATMTSGAGGEAGLPVCSACLYAIQFYPLATLKVSGRPLFWWSAQHEWMYGLTKNFALRVSQIVEGSPDELPNLSWPSTQLFEAVEAVLRAADGAGLPLADLIGCHATNYGSGPEYNEIRIRRSVVEFLRAGQRYEAYRAMVENAKESPEEKKPKSKAAKESPDGTRKRNLRNYFYEDLGHLIAGGGRLPGNLIQRYFKPLAGRQPGVFELACLFGRKVLEMKQEQVEAIKTIAGRIGLSKQAERYLERLFQRTGILNYVRTLTEISDRMKRAGEEPIGLDTVLQAFDLATEGDTSGRDGALVRELVLIRLIEVLPAERLQGLNELESGKEEGE